MGQSERAGLHKTLLNGTDPETFPSFPWRPPRHLAVLDLDDGASQGALERLHGDVTAHVSARLPWIQAWREAHPEWRSWVLALLNGSEIRAVAPLARRDRAGFVQVRCLGHTNVDHSPILCRTADDAIDLASEVADQLRHLGRPWTLDLVRQPSGSAFVASLAGRLPVSEMRSDAERPIVVFDRFAERRFVLSRNLRQAESKARNRIARAGLTLEIRWITEPREVSDRITEIRWAHRARDLQLRGISLLDDPQEGHFYDALLGRHLDLLDLLEIRLDGELAAYVLWVRNASARLVLDNRVAPCWTAYSAGLIANNVALRAAADNPTISVLDWGTGVQRYKLQSANKVLTHERLLSWSSSNIRRSLAARRRLLRPCRLK